METKKSNRPNTKDFLKNRRKQQTQPQDEVQIFQITKSSTSSSKTLPKSEQLNYLEICVDPSKFYLPLEVACISRWIHRLFKENKGQFQEQTSLSISFPEFSAEALERVVGWLCADYSLNGAYNEDQQRIIFQFSLPGELVMDILSISYFLEIPPLTESCITMLSDYMDDIPSIHHLPSDLVFKLLSRLPPLKLYSVEQQPECRDMHFDTTQLWMQHYQAQHWGIHERRYMCSWEKSPVISEPIMLQNSLHISTNIPSNIRDLFIERHFQELCDFPTTQSKRKKNFILDIANKSIVSHSVPKSESEQYYDRLPNLSFLEIHIDSESDYRSLIQYLESHHACKTLKICLSAQATSSSSFDISDLLYRTSLTSLDLSETSNRSKWDQLLLSELSNPSKAHHLKNLSLRDVLLSIDIDKAMEMLSYSRLEIVDLTNTCRSGLSPNIVQSNLPAKTLILQGNDLHLKALDNVFPHGFAESLVRTIPLTIRRLDLSKTKLMDEFIPLLCRYINDNRIPLESLSLYETGIQQESVSAISTMIRYNQTLTYLDLSWNSINRRDCIELGKSLSINQTLTAIDFSGNLHMNDEAAKNIFNALVEKPNASLKFLILDAINMKFETKNEAAALLPNIIISKYKK